MHINELEIKAILLALQAIGKFDEGSHIQIRSDSTTAVAYVNNMGGINSKICNDLAKQIWDYCIRANIWVSCQHVPGTDNVADSPSRKFNDDLEWQLCNEVFHLICEEWGQPSIDLFASRTNHKLDTYCAWRRDPQASFIDALAQNWHSFKLCYIFPPFSMIGKCLQKLCQDQAEAIIIAPLWPQQLWFPKLLRTLVDRPLVLPSTEHILSLAHSTIKHPLSPKLKLIACRISGNNMNSRGFLMRLSNSSSHRGDHQPRVGMQPTSQIGLHFAVEGISIPFHHM